MLHDVRQRLLHDPVQRRFDLAGQSPLSETVLEIDRDPGLLGERLGQALERRHEPEVVERLRSQLDRELANVVQRRHDVLAQLGHRRVQLVPVDHLVEHLQPQHDRGQRLARLVVQLPGEPPALDLLRVDDPPQRIARDALRQIDRDRRARAERLREAQVGVGEARVRPELVVHLDHADRSLADEQRHPEAGARADETRDVTVHLGVVEDGIDALAAAPLEHAAAFRRVARDRLADELAAPSPAAATKRSSSLPAGRRMLTILASRRSRSRRTTRSSKRSMSVSVATAFPTSISDSSWRDQFVAAS